MTMAGSVHTIILNWRTAEMTIRSLDCAVAAMDGIPGMITVVDNDSGDGSFERISAHVAQAGLARARVVQSGRNGGFGAGNNVAMFDPLPDGGAPDAPRHACARDAADDGAHCHQENV